MSEAQFDRRTLIKLGLAAGMATIAAPPALAQQDPAADKPKRVRVAIIGCGSVSNMYLPHLSKCPHVELVAVCDRIPARAKAQAAKFKVPNQYPHVDQLLAGVPFDLLVNLTDMQEHEHLNVRAVEAGKHVWSEKPMANSYAAGRALLDLAKRKGVRVWGAPAMVQSPQFAFMARVLAAGKLGRVAAAHADYGHTGPGWSAFFYEEGGGSLPDLAVYNLTTLTGLLGPAVSVVGMTSVVTPTRRVGDKGQIKVVAEDNAMLLMEHANGVIAHVQSGFNYFNPHGHDGSKEGRHTVSIVGSAGSMGLVGYDWAPNGVDLATRDAPAYKRETTDAGDFVWQMGASLAAEHLATGRQILVDPEHALHVLEVMQATRDSQRTGRRVAITSTFKWPVVA